MDGNETTTRGVNIILRVSLEEREFLRTMATHAGLPISSYVRMCAIMRSHELLAKAHDRTQADRVIAETTKVEA